MGDARSGMMGPCSPSKSGIACAITELELARNDPRVVAGVEVGSLALGGGDR
jgi:hypothetical protein